MAVPKKRTGHSDQGHRRSNWKATVPAISSCPNCGAPRHPHTLCGVCGYYKDRVVLKAMLDEDISADAFFPGSDAAATETPEAAVDVAEEKPKKAKKSAKKEAAPVENTVEDTADAGDDATSEDATEN